MSVTDAAVELPLPPLVRMNPIPPPPADDDCAECPDVQPGTACPVCDRPMPALVHDVEETRTPAPIWDTDPRGEA